MILLDLLPDGISIFSLFGSFWLFIPRSLAGRLQSHKYNFTFRVGVVLKQKYYDMMEISLV